MTSIEGTESHVDIQGTMTRGSYKVSLTQTFAFITILTISLFFDLSRVNPTTDAFEPALNEDLSSSPL